MGPAPAELCEAMFSSLWYVILLYVSQVCGHHQNSPVDLENKGVSQDRLTSLEQWCRPSKIPQRNLCSRPRQAFQDAHCKEYIHYMDCDPLGHVKEIQFLRERRVLKDPWLANCVFLVLNAMKMMLNNPDEPRWVIGDQAYRGVWMNCSLRLHHIFPQPCATSCTSRLLGAPSYLSIRGKHFRNNKGNASATVPCSL